MDKKLILAVAGSGKTTHIVNSITDKERVLIVTYTDANYENIIAKIRMVNDGVVPQNIMVFTYFIFLYQFCYKPFLSDDIQAKGICYDNNPNKYMKQSKLEYFLDGNGRLYSNHIALLLENYHVVEDIKRRIEKYFDCFIIDEVQDISGRDFNFSEQLFSAKVAGEDIEKPVPQKAKGKEETL